MIRALARAWRWVMDLLGGVHGSISALSDAYGTNAGYVARHLPLACLSPALVTLILEGRQPVVSEARQSRELTTWALPNRIEIPADWSEQARRLGCACAVSTVPEPSEDGTISASRTAIALLAADSNATAPARRQAPRTKPYRQLGQRRVAGPFRRFRDDVRDAVEREMQATEMSPACAPFCGPLMIFYHFTSIA